MTILMLIGMVFVIIWKMFHARVSLNQCFYIYIYGHKWSTTHRVLKSHRSKMSIIYMLSWKQCALPVITTMGTHALGHMMYGYVYILLVPILHSSCFCDSWAHCVSWITYNHLYYAPSLACWALFGSLVPAICNSRSCTEVHGLPQHHFGNNWEGTLFSGLHIYVYIYIYIYMYIYIYWYLGVCVCCEDNPMRQSSSSPQWLFGNM